MRLHVDAVGRISFSPKKTKSILLWKPPTGTESAPVQKISTSSNEQGISSAKYEEINYHTIIVSVYFRNHPKVSKKHICLLLYSSFFIG